MLCQHTSLSNTCLIRMLTLTWGKGSTILAETSQSFQALKTSVWKLYQRFSGHSHSHSLQKRLLPITSVLCIVNSFVVVHPVKTHFCIFTFSITCLWLNITSPVFSVTLVVLECDVKHFWAAKEHLVHIFLMGAKVLKIGKNWRPFSPPRWLVNYFLFCSNIHYCALHPLIKFQVSVCSCIVVRIFSLPYANPGFSGISKGKNSWHGVT